MIELTGRVEGFYIGMEAARRQVRSAATPLTVRQSAVLFAVAELTAARGFPPTVREVAARIGISFVRAKQLIGRLVELGRLTREAGVARSLRVA